MNAYAVASASGLAFGFYFFLAMSAAIAAMIYALLTIPSLRRTEIGLPVVRKVVAAPFAFLIWVVLFATIYLTSLAGFHTVAVNDAGVRFDYVVPNRSISLGYAEIGDVIRRPAYRSLWRLQIYTVTGNKFESAPGSYRPIKQAAEEIDRHRKP